MQGNHSSSRRIQEMRSNETVGDLVAFANAMQGRKSEKTVLPIEGSHRGGHGALW